MFDSLPILLLLILSGGLGGNGDCCNTSGADNKNTLAMCLCLLLLSGGNDGCSDF